MNEMTRQELEERLLDYLYDELDASERAAFEQALPRHPEVEREVVAHRATRRAYQALPREAAPAGLLDRVLAEADQEAARRAKPDEVVAVEKAAPAGPGFWERLRRLVFQPAFAMATVVLVVAGVSLVATRKGDLPGMGPSTDAQRLPPVAVNQGAPPAAPVGAAAAPRVADEEVAPEPAAAASTLDLAAEGAADRRNEAAGDEGDLAALADGLVEKRLEAPVVADPGKLGTRSEGEVKAPKASGETLWGGDVAGQGGFGNVPADAPAPPPQKGLLAKEDQKPAEVVDAVRAKDTTAGGGVPAEPARPAPAKPATEPLRDASLDAGGDDKMKGPAPAARPAAPEPPTVTKVPAGRGDSDDKKVVDESEESEHTDRDVSTTEQPKREAERVATTESARTPSPDIDDDGKTTPPKTTPTLTPPASPERLWSTYQQQLAAGAWADAQRSIEALAKLEGESARVKQARAELKKKLEAGGKTNTGADKIPPDPPVQPPK